MNAPLRNLLLRAFQVQGFQLLNVPDWVANERFDVVAKLKGDPPMMPPGSLPTPD